jgi:hypothetical protein
MAIPELYWMLECTQCAARLVVHDSYLEFVGTSDPNPSPGDGYGDVPLPERCSCPKGCQRSLNALGSIFDASDREMWLHEPHVPIALTKAQSAGWRRLIEEAGYVGNADITFVPPRRPWWKAW